MPPVKNPCVMTSYGGIIRIRLKGRSSITSSQPANTSSPVFEIVIINKSRRHLLKEWVTAPEIIAFSRKEDSVQNIVYSVDLVTT